MYTSNSYNQDYRIRSH